MEGLALTDIFSSNDWAFPQVWERFELANVGEAGPDKGQYPFVFLLGRGVWQDNGDSTAALICVPSIVPEIK